jgi:hypothetical protein
MGILRDFEKRLEGAVEGFFARAFRSGLQPVELAKALQRYAADYQQIGVDGVYVPNVYRFELAADDLERFQGFESSLRKELADVVRRTAADRGWRLRGSVRIELREREDVTVGTYELRGKVEGPQEQPRGERGALPHPPAAEPAESADERPGATRVMEAPARRRAWLHVLSGQGSGRRFPVEDEAVVGRLPECDVTLDDPSVSRRHARISLTDGQWEIEDLGSTNGVRVNGSSVSRAPLRDGDRVELGSARLAFGEER